ncbi:RxLR effector candidate protein-like protein [Pseudoscourfieldia marina]
MTNYKYAELFAANVHERHQRIALELVTDLDPDDDNAIIIPDIIRRTNERASLHDRIIRANPENRRRRLALPVQGRGGGRNGGRTGGRGGRNTERFDPRDTTDAAKMQTVQLHTLTTLRCVMRLAARVTTQHVGAATPTQAAEVAVDEADIKVAEADEEDDTRCRHSTAAALHATATPKLPTAWRHAAVSSATTTVAIAAHANNIARVGEAFPTMNAPPPTGQMYQTGPYRRTFAITLATNEPNCSKYIVDNASPYTLTGSLNHLYDVQQLEKPKEIGGIKKDSTIKCTHVGKIDFTTHEGTLTVSNAYYGFYFGQIDVETAYLYALMKKTPRRVTSPTVCGCNPLRGSHQQAALSSTVRAMSHVMSKPPSNFEACKKHVRYLSGTINRGIKYNTNSNVPLKLIGYCDASRGDNHENRRSTSGYIFFLNGGPISWASYLQTTVALSTVESEVMALTEAIKEAIYIRRLLESLARARRSNYHLHGFNRS